MPDFIETVMHQLGLGVAKSNFELCSQYMADAPAKSGLSQSDFLRSVQALLVDLKGFLLGWLQAYPLNGCGVASKHTTGGWAGENWMCYLRLSKYLHAWCCKNQTVASRHGADDLRRTINSFHAFTARCMTHAGIDSKFVTETELYMKEFLSCVKEFDIRVRHKKTPKTDQATVSSM